MKLKNWPKNLRAQEIRDKMEELDCYIDELQNEYEELVMELERRHLK